MKTVYFEFISLPASLFTRSCIFPSTHPTNTEKYWKHSDEQKRHDPRPHGGKQGCLALKIGFLRFLSHLPNPKNEITLLSPALHALFNTCLSGIAMLGLVLVLGR